MVEAENDSMPPDEDINTTAPQSAPDEWRMPEPVFRKTSGRLPKGFDQPFEPGAEARVYSNDESQPRSRPAATVLPQEPRPKSPTLKILVLIAALGGMVAFLLVFLSVIYYLFFRSSE